MSPASSSLSRLLLGPLWRVRVCINHHHVSLQSRISGKGMRVLGTHQDDGSGALRLACGGQTGGVQCRLQGPAERALLLPRVVKRSLVAASLVVGEPGGHDSC
jgi:hypothetical protein